MPFVTPCPTAVRRRPPRGASADQRAFARHFGDVYEAGTLLRTDGIWSLVMTPTQDQMAAADLVLQGGHETFVSSLVAEEILAAGFCVSEVDVAAADGTYPAPILFPATDLYPGVIS